MHEMRHGSMKTSQLSTNICVTSSTVVAASTSSTVANFYSVYLHYVRIHDSSARNEDVWCGYKIFSAWFQMYVVM